MPIRPLPSKEELINAVNQCYSLTQVSKFLGYKSTTINSNVKKLIKKYKINCNHFNQGPPPQSKYFKYLNTTIGHFTVIEVYRVIYSSWREWRIKCKCKCGTIKDFNSKAFINLKIKQCENCRVYDKFEMPQTKWRMLELGAIDRGLELSITKEYVSNLLKKQNFKCALSGIPIKFGRVHWSEENTASLDRIDSTKGYIEGNVQWVHKTINFMKMNFTQDEFIKFCYLVVEKHKNETCRNTQAC